MRPTILFVGPNVAHLAEISSALDPMNYAQVIAHSVKPMEYLAASKRTSPQGGVVEMAGTEKVAEVQEVLRMSPATGFVLLIEEMPPSAAMARVAGTQAVFMDKREPALTVAATLVSLLYQRDFAELHK